MDTNKSIKEHANEVSKHMKPNIQLRFNNNKKGV